VEKNGRVGKKILVTGNGRCNLSNTDIRVENYHGANPRFVTSALHQLDGVATLDFFEGLGVMAWTEEGKIYPYSLQASSVLDVLRTATAMRGIEEICEFDCVHLQKAGEGFVVCAKDGRTFRAKRVIAACGSIAGIKGDEGGSYGLLEWLGHTRTALYPSLVQLKTRENPASVKGVKFMGTACVYVDGTMQQEEYGEILFTDYGLSGPPIFALSRIASVETAAGRKVEIGLNLMSDKTKDEIYAHLLNRNRHVPLEGFLIGMLHKLVAVRLLKEITDQKMTAQATVLNGTHLYRLAELICDWRFEITGTNPWSAAQVCAGGICTEEFNPSTMESKLVQGLYCTGEMLDIDGDCGGYNLQWAWSSGAVAGMHAAQGLGVR